MKKISIYNLYRLWKGKGVDSEMSYPCFKLWLMKQFIDTPFHGKSINFGFLGVSVQVEELLRLFKMSTSDLLFLIKEKEDEKRWLHIER